MAANLGADPGRYDIDRVEFFSVYAISLFECEYGLKALGEAMIRAGQITDLAGVCAAIKRGYGQPYRDVCCAGVKRRCASGVAMAQGRFEVLNEPTMIG
jgi:hypothetical protein